MNLRLKEICETKKIAVGALADKIGMSRPNMYNLVNGKITPSVEKLNEIATALDVELWELFTPSTEKGEFMALVKNGSTFRYATSFDELKGIVADMEQVSQG